MSSAISSIEVSRQPNKGVRLSGLKYVGDLVAAEIFEISQSSRPEDLHPDARDIAVQHATDVQPPMTPPEIALVTDYAISRVTEAHTALRARLESHGIRAEKPVIHEEADV
jgi:hypothetical protein